MPGTTPKDASRALLIAADKIGANNYDRQRKAWKKSARTFRFTVTSVHRAVIDASYDVMAGRISVNDAMAILHMHDVMAERFPKS